MPDDATFPKRDVAWKKLTAAIREGVASPALQIQLIALAADYGHAAAVETLGSVTAAIKQTSPTEARDA